MTAKAAIISWPVMQESIVFNSMVKTCKEFDIILDKVTMPANCSAIQLYELIKQHINVITWRCPFVSEEIQKQERNIAFLDNGILNSQDYFYFDDNGFGSTSNIVAYGLNKEKYPIWYKEEVFGYLEKCDWPLRFGYTEKGYFLVALQGRLREDRELLEKCEAFLPKNIGLCVREHPGVPDAGRTRIYEEFCDRNDWIMDTVATPFESLKYVRALITNFSTLMYKALAMEIPVATCMRGFHSGTSAVLDCSREPEMLRYILDFRFNREASENLICSLHSSALSKNAKVGELLRNTNFANWLKRIRRN